MMSTYCLFVVFGCLGTFWNGHSVYFCVRIKSVRVACFVYIEGSSMYSTSSSYFSRLGAGHSLTSNSTATNKHVSLSTSASASGTSKGVGGTKSEMARVIEDKGRFRYIYEVNAKTNQKRLVRRVPIPKSSVFQGQGHSLSQKRGKC